MTDNDFIAAMKRGLPPIAPPTLIGIDFGTGSEKTVVTEIDSAGAVSNFRVIQPPQEQA
ncbi:MAG: hypothetical protein ACN6PO_02555 [Stenotrophomonas bentonitica]